jgi:GT2 family glycosyltransferase
MPAYNAEATVAEALTALRATLRVGDELIVFDDGSTDATGAIAARAGALVLRNEGGPLGPAHGRNTAAAQARNELLFFVDADVVIAPDTLDRLVHAIACEGGDAAFGSYDDSPRSVRAASLYMNLRHHFVHQLGSRNATTFWAGIGLIRRSIFTALNGFDQRRFETSSIEDVELGMRMVEAGYRTFLIPEAQGTHLKDWKLGQVWRTDIFRRAVPWSRLIAEKQNLGADLNVAPKERTNAALALTLIPASLLAIVWPSLALALAALAIGYIAGNRDFFGFLARRLSPSKLVTAVAMHWCYHVYASTTLAIVTCWRRLGSPSGAGPTRRAR